MTNFEKIQWIVENFDIDLLLEKGEETIYSDMGENEIKVAIIQHGINTNLFFLELRLDDVVDTDTETYDCSKTYNLGTGMHNTVKQALTDLLVDASEVERASKIPMIDAIRKYMGGGEHYVVTLYYHTNVVVDVQAISKEDAIAAARDKVGTGQFDESIIDGLQEDNSPDVELFKTN